MKVHTKTHQPKIRLDVEQMAAFAALLRTERLRQGLSLARTARNIGLTADQLTAVEQWEEALLPPVSYRVGLLEKYAELLRVPNPSKLQPKSPPRHSEAPKKRTIIVSRFAAVGAITGIGVLVFIYVASAAYSLVAKPKLILQSPVKDGVVDNGQVTVSGLVGAETLVQINGQAVTINEQKHFTETIYLRHGQNEVAVRAVNSFGRSSEATRYLYYP